MTKNLELFKQRAKEEHVNASVTQFIDWAIDQSLITDHAARDYNIKYDFKELTKQNPDSSLNDKLLHLEVVHTMSRSPLYQRVKDL